MDYVLNKEIISDTTEYSDELPNNEDNLTTEVFYSSWESLGNNQYYRYARSYIMPFYSNDLQKYSEVDVDDISPYIIKDMGKYNKKFVDEQFNFLLNFLKNMEV